MPSRQPGRAEQVPLTGGEVPRRPPAAGAGGPCPGRREARGWGLLRGGEEPVALEEKVGSGPVGTLVLMEVEFTKDKTSFLTPPALAAQTPSCV